MDCTASGFSSLWRPAWNELREKWQQVPFLQRIFTVTITAFALQVLFFSILLSYEQTNVQYGKRLAKYGAAVQKIVDIFPAFDAEEDTALAFMTNQTQSNLAAALAAQQKTEDAQNAFLEMIPGNWPDLEFDPQIELDQGTLTTESGLRSAAVPRAGLIPGGLQLSPQGCRNTYALSKKLPSSVIVKFAASMNIKTNALGELRRHFSGIMSYHLAEAHKGARSFLSSTSQTAAQNALSSLVINMNTFTMVKEYFLLPLLTTEQAMLLSLQLEGATLTNMIKMLQTEASTNWTFALPAQFDTNPQAAEISTQAVVALRDAMSSLQSPSVEYVARYGVMVGVAAAVIAVCIAQWIYFEIKNAEKNAIRVRNARIMHDVLARVGETVRSMVTFTLDPLPPPKSMLGTRVGVLELRLQQCLASLKVLAPALPPLLFPKRLAIIASENSEVKDPATMNFARKIRDNLLKEPLQLLSTDSEHAEDDPCVLEMRRITDLHTREAQAAFVFIDMQAFHTMSNPEQIQFSDENYHAIVTIIEECIYQFNGVMCSAALDKVVGVWNIAEETDAYCEQAATCGLVLASRLSQQRKQTKSIRENFPVRVGVVAGDVTVGVFGNNDHKVLQIFGVPLTTGILVARANGFHMTTVACDDQIRKAVDRIYPCKPIELMENGGCIYEVIHEQSRKEVDLETKLSVYCKAFELFQRKYYREALRAFRGYTKLYGYDCSVERIQAIITGV